MCKRCVFHYFIPPKLPVVSLVTHVNYSLHKATKKENMRGKSQFLFTFL